MWIIRIRHEQIISLVWTNGDNFGFGINNSDPVWIKLFRFFSDYWSFEDKVGLISFTRNYAGPFQGIFALSVRNWRATQWFLLDRDARNASCQIWPFSRHRRWGNFCGNWQFLEKSFLVICLTVCQQFDSFSGFFRTLIPAHVVSIRYIILCRQHLYGQTCKNSNNSFLPMA